MTSDSGKRSDAVPYVEAMRAQVESYLSEVVPDGRPQHLFDACRYVLASGGKRVRPLLVLLAAETAAGTTSDIRKAVLPLAAACEVFHNFTLVHDDIMDRSDLRRGRETVHKRWDEGTAILVGDYLLSIAYGLIERANVSGLPEIRNRFGRMVKRLCEGQALDMTFAAGDSVSMDDYLDMIDGKTGALLACCLEIGALAGGADEIRASAFRQAGLDLGRAFQIQDDLLDATSEADKWGKPVGQDLVEGKQTFLVVDMMESGSRDDRQVFSEALENGGFRIENTAAAIRRLRLAGVIDRARDAVGRYSERARAAFAAQPDTPATRELLALVAALSRRSY